MLPSDRMIQNIHAYVHTTSDNPRWMDIQSLPHATKLQLLSLFILVVL